MIKKTWCGFLGFMRFIVCFCLIAFFITRTFSEAYGGTSEGSGKTQGVGLQGTVLKLSETPQSDISQAVKNAGYWLNTGVSDFGDYKIETNVSDPDVIAIAIHGGKIETGTTELAYALASRNNYSYYSYLGVKITDNFHLHIDSKEFDETVALKMVSQSETTISIHGCGGLDEFTYVGGRASELADKVKESLTKHGFTVLEAPAELAGMSPDNIANKNKKGAGVQIELSQGLRTRLLADGGNLMEKYVLAVGEAIDSHSAEVSR